MTKMPGLVAIGWFALCGCSGSSDAGDDADAGSVADSGSGSGVQDSGAPAGDSGAMPAGDAAAPPADPRDGPGIFAAAGNHLRHFRSIDDGVSWIDDATLFDESMTGDAYGIRTVAAVNGQFTAFAAKMFSSPDGKSWTEVTKADGQWLASMVYAQGQYVSSGGYGWLATTTTDLGSWTQHPPAANYTAAHHSRMALAAGMVGSAMAYVVVDDDGNIFHGSDGKTWSAASGAPVVPAGATWGAVFAYGNGIFVGVLPSGTASIQSTDGGATWKSNADLPSKVQGLVYAKGKFTALGSGHVFTSTDGSAWTDHAEATAFAADLTYGHGVYLALSGNGDIYRSTDGLVFAKAFSNLTNPDPAASIAFGPSGK